MMTEYKANSFSLPLHDGGPYDIETSHVIYTTN